MLDKGHLDDLRLRLEEWLERLLSQGGVPAVDVRDMPGAWTTAEGLKNLLEFSEPELQTIKPALDFLLDAQLPDGGWSLIDDTESCTISTSDALCALRKAKLSYPNHNITRDVEMAIERGEDYILNCQNEDGGWGLHAGRSYISRVFCTAYVLIGLTPGGKGAEAIQRCIDNYLPNCRDIGGHWRPSKDARNPDQGLTPMLLEVYRIHGPALVDELVILVNKSCTVGIYNLPAWGLDEERFTRAQGLLSITRTGEYWGTRACLRTGKPFCGLPSFIAWAEETDSVPHEIRCHLSGSHIAGSIWTSIETYELLSLLVNDLEGGGKCLKGSILAAGDCMVTCALRDGVKSECQKILDEGELLGSFSADLLLTESLVLLQSVFRVMQQMKAPSADKLLSRIEQFAMVRLKGISDRDELAGFVELCGCVKFPEPMLGSVQFILMSLSSLSCHDYGRGLSLALQGIDGATNPLFRDVLTVIRDLTITLDGVDVETSNAVIAERARKAKALQEKLIQKMDAVFDGRAVAAMTEEVVSQIRNCRERVARGTFVSSDIACDLKEGNASQVRIYLRYSGVAIHEMAVKIDLSEQFDLRGSHYRIANSLGNDDYEVCVTVVPKISGEIEFRFNVVCYGAEGIVHSEALCHRPHVRARAICEASDWVHMSYRYASGMPVDDWTNEGSRAYVLEQVVSNLSENHVAVAILGEPRIGKTSFLRALTHKLEQNENMIVSETSVEMVKSGSGETFIAHLLDVIMESLKKACIKTAQTERRHIFHKLEQSPLGRLDSLKVGCITFKAEESAMALDGKLRELRNFIEEVSSLLESDEKKLVVIVDEASQLVSLGNYQRILSLLRSIIQSSRINLVIAAADSMNALYAKDSNFVNFFERYDIPPFDLADVNRLIALSGLPWVWLEGEKEYLRKETSGRPYWISATLNEIIDMLNKERRKEVARDDIVRALDLVTQRNSQVLAQVFMSNIPQYHENSDLLEIILQEICRSNGILREEELVARVGKIAHVEPSVISSSIDTLVCCQALKRGDVISVNNRMLARCRRFGW